MNRENVEKLRDYLRDDVPEAKFRMSVFITGGDYDKRPAARLKECGSAACIGGWAVALFAPHSQCVRDNAKRVLGLTWDEADNLFEPSGLMLRPQAYTRRRAVETLTRLLETGEIDWGTR